MIHFPKLLPAMVLSLCIAGGTGSMVAAEKIRVLIVTGQNNHDWQRSTPAIKALLEETDRFTVTVSTTPSEEAPEDAWNDWKPNFKSHQAVISDYNGKMWPEPIKAEFVEYVESGGGLVLVHAANNAFTGWKEFEEMCGLMWRDASYGERIHLDEKMKLVRTPKGEGPGAGHGHSHAYQITVTDQTHPIFKGMPERWMHVSDELYHGQRGPAHGMHILAVAFSSKESNGTGVYEPMAWWIPRGKGKVVTLLPGHLGAGQDRPHAFDCIGFRAVVQRSTEWAATGSVTLSLPTNFPTATATSTVSP